LLDGSECGRDGFARHESRRHLARETDVLDEIEDALLAREEQEG